ncbi:lactate racemase domain-containing protein [Myxococcota bacterium]
MRVSSLESNPSTIGRGSASQALGSEEVRQLVAEFVAGGRLDGKRVLALIPDHTRSAPLPLLFRILHEWMVPRVERLDFLVALGTHPPMSQAAIDRLLGLAPGELASRYSQCSVYNHDWRDPQNLVNVGTIPADHLARISGGMMREAIPVTVNRRILEYELLLIVGPTFPHEVVGFSGGNKYLFPGVAGPDIIDAFHWLGALFTSPMIIGHQRTAVRSVVDAAAAMVPVPRLCISLVVGSTGLLGLYCGTPEQAWARAADLSAQVHVQYHAAPYRSVLSCAPAMYDELWVGAKAAYKLEPVVADGGELILYAPHITAVSAAHGAFIQQIGYHVRDYFVHQMDRFAHVPRGVLAHSTHLKGLGTYQNGQEQSRIHLVLATGIPENLCRQLNVGYRDPRTIRPEQFQNRTAEGVLYVPKAGEVLHRLRDDPFVSGR